MDKDELGTRFPRVGRLLGGYDVLSAEAPESSALADGNVLLIPSARAPAILINLSDLEAALTGFRDTGTWDDYFPPADDTSGDPKLSAPNRGAGIARYRIDTSEDENTK